MLTENKARKPSTHLETTHNPKRGKRIKYRGQEGRRRGGAGPWSAAREAKGPPGCWGRGAGCADVHRRPGLVFHWPGFSLGRAPELRLFAKGCLNDIYNLQESL